MATPIWRKRLQVMTRQRSAGKHIPHTPIWIDWKWFNHSGVGFFNLTIGNPYKHYRWAFQAWFYYKGV